MPHQRKMGRSLHHLPLQCGAPKHLEFVPAGRGFDVSGETVSAVTIRRDKDKDYRVILAGREKYRSVLAHWQNQV